MEWFEKEEDELTRLVNSGEITPSEYRKEMTILHRELQRQAEDEAQDAYDRHMGFSY